MNALRSILVHLDASPRSTRRLVLARQLAARHAAHLGALYGSTPAALSLPYVMTEGAGELLAMLQQLDIDYRDAARMRFEQALASDPAPVEWRELRGTPLIPGFTAQALCTDLLVLGQHDAADPMTTGVPRDFVASVLLDSGRPALVVPYVESSDPVGEQVLIAWKSTRESAHAVTAAIPILQRARQIDLTSADDADPANAAALEAYLRLHGIDAPIRRHASVPAETAGDALLSLAADVGADLLVMGCYGHSRARERVLGGASRTVLESMTLPVLMAH